MMHSTDSLLTEIVTVLETHSLDPKTYTLYDYFDPEALEKLVDSADSNLEVQITIEEVQLSITQNDVNILK